MKKYAVLLLCCVACSVWGKMLPISDQGEQEAALFLDFLQAEFALQQGEKEACALYKKLQPRAPQSKLLRRQVLACALAADDMQTADQFADFFDPNESGGEDCAVYAFYQLRKGNLSQAQTYYEQALEKSPEDTRILYQYILLLSMLDVDRAAAKLQARKEAYPDAAAMLDYNTGNLYLQRKDVVKALEYYNRATEENPQYAEPYLARADIYEKTGKFFLMLRELETLEKTGYESAAMFSRMGSVYVLGKDHARAKAYFLKAKSLDPSDISAGYFLALYAEQDKQFEQAAQYLRETADFEKDGGKWLQVSFYQQSSGDTQGALRTLEQAYRKFDANVEVAYFYALLLQDNKQYRKSARVLEKILETNPKYENARMAYAFALEALGKYALMETQLRLVLAQNPNHAAAYNLLGFSLADRNIRLQEAQELVTKALELNPGDRAFADSLAWVYFRQGKYEQALDLLRGLDKAFVAQNADVSYHLGAVYQALGQVEQAREYLQQAAPVNKEAKRLLNKLPPVGK